MIRSIFFYLLIVGSAINGNSQDLAFYADAMINADKAEHRIFASQKFEELFTKELEYKDSYSQEFKELEWISIVYPNDKSFRTISWQVNLGEGNYKYVSFLQTEDQLWSIGDEGDMALDEYGKIQWIEWGGALIYNIVESGDTYTLYTFRYIDEYTKVKTLESLNINGEYAELGYDQFQDGEGALDYKDRLVLEYSSDANATLNYQETNNRIVYDNLIAVMGRMDGQGPTMVPDGSYKSYDLVNGKWRAKDKLFDQVMQSPPRSTNRQKAKKDILGRSKGN